nr:MAG TPA: tail protein [Caudoviricetes sp.]
MSKINNYLPKCLRDIVDFKLINEDLDEELNKLYKLISNINCETIVLKSSKYGIKRWENTLNISNNNDDLNLRRFRVNNILTNKLPYTSRWLNNKLKQLTNSDNAFILNIDNNNHEITIVLAGLNTELMFEVQKQLRKIIPANMELKIGGPALTINKIKVGTNIRIGTIYNIKSNYSKNNY